MKENIGDPKFVESVCEDGGPAKTVPCLQGMASMHINHHGRLAPTNEMCGRLAPGNEEVCRGVIRAMSPMFEA
ncbi:MAG: hypothetical protein H0U65_00170 [Rubrobacter sp.]|nr:hypothetical protein [Rubrobacter sp.]